MNVRLHATCVFWLLILFSGVLPARGDQTEVIAPKEVVRFFKGDKLEGAYHGQFMAGLECQIIEGGTGDFELIPGKRADGSRIPVLIIVETAKHRDYAGQPVWKKGGKRVTLSDQNGFRVSWFNHDPQWENVLGYQPKNDPPEEFPSNAKAPRWTSAASNSIHSTNPPINWMTDIWRNPEDPRSPSPGTRRARPVESGLKGRREPNEF